MSQWINVCKNCGAKIFRPVNSQRWVHVEPRMVYCFVQQAIDYMPFAAPPEGISQKQSKVLDELNSGVIYKLATGIK